MTHEEREVQRILDKVALGVSLFVWVVIAYLFGWVG